MAREILRFEDFELDRGAYQLRRAGAPVRLERIPLELLFLLVEQPGQLVTRQQILERLWGKGLFIDFDASINGAVRKLRRALHDDAASPRFVVTVPAKGYRFAAPILEAGTGILHISPARISFVGREREITTLRAGLVDAVSGRGRMFLISGGPGIGKTRLAEQMAEQAQAAGMAVLVGHSTEQEDAVPYLPFVEILETCADRAAGPAGLRALLAEEGPELARLLPKLKRLLPDLPPPLELSPQQARRHLFNCFCDFAARLARQQPMLLIFDDLHWADESTLALLGHLAQRVAELPLLVVATYREVDLKVVGGLAKTLEELLRKRFAVAIGLKGLRREEVALMLASLSGQSPPPAVVREIYEETNGNPFFVEELFQYLKEEDRLFDAQGSFRNELRISELEVPQSVRLVVGRRLARLSDATQQVLAVAAVIGRSFAFKVLDACTNGHRLLERVEEAERTGLILSSEENSRFEFSHELTRQAVISDLSAVRRQQLHLEVATAIERIYSDTLEDHYAELIHHNIRCGDSHKALHYLELAAQRASMLGAFERGLTHIRSALELLQTLPDVAERTKVELHWQLSLAASLGMLQGWSVEEIGRSCRRALDLSRQTANDAALMRTLNMLRLFHVNRGELRSAADVAGEHLAMAVRLRDRVGEVWSRIGLGEVLILLGQFALSLEHNERATAIYDTELQTSEPAAAKKDWTERSSGSGPDFRELRPYCAYTACGPSWTLGFPDRARRKSAEAVRLAQDADVHVLAWALWHTTWMHLNCGDTDAARERIERLVRITGQYGLNPSFLTSANNMRALLLMREGRVADAIGILREIPEPPHRHLAQAYAQAGEAQSALRAVTQAFEELGRGEARNHAAEIHRLMGEILLMQPKPDETRAERWFHEAIAIARDQSAKSLELRATTTLAKLLRDSGRQHEAGALLAEIYNWFTEGFDTADLKDAKTLLEELSG